MSVVQPRMSNKDRIAIIMDFFGVAQATATFMFHRKLQGYPFKKRDDPKFLDWNLSIQNAIIKADRCVGLDWEEIKFGTEDYYLSQKGILIKDQSNTEVFKHDRKYNHTKEISEDDGWSIVKDIRKINHRQIKVLQTMGFFPRYTKKESYTQRIEKEDQSDK